MRGFTDSALFGVLMIAGVCMVAWLVYLTVLACSYTHQVFDPPAACQPCECESCGCCEACDKCEGCCQANPQDACPCTP